MNHRIPTFASLTVLLLALVWGFHPAAADVSLWNPINESEPNNTPAQADPITYGSLVNGLMGESDLIDYFKFSGQAGQKVAFPDQEYYQDVTLVLFDKNNNPVPLNDASRWAVLPSNGAYVLQVTGPEWEDYELAYGFYVVLLAGDEPNDSMTTAAPVTAGQVVNSQHDYPCDTDWYRFTGRAGDVFPIVWNDSTYWGEPEYSLYDAAGNLLYGVQVLPADGTYYLEYSGWTVNDDDAYCNDGPYTVTIGYPMWVSADVDGLGGNTAIKQGDISMRTDQPGKWQLVFDASDVGIIKDVVAIERMDDGSILMSLTVSQTVPGLGKVMPQDIIRFIPTSLGTNTAGTLEWYLDGSDVGLTTTGERIDAISFGTDPSDPNPLRISITGSGSVPRQSGGNLGLADEDLINFVATAYGANTAGKWRMSLDGSTVAGMAAEDINAATTVAVFPGRFSTTLLSFLDNSNIAGVSGTSRDVQIAGGGMAVKNLTDKKIDGLTIGVTLP